MLDAIILRRSGGLIALALLLGFSARLEAQLSASGCAMESSLYSTPSTTQLTLTFVNETSGPVSIYWLNFTGQRVFYQTVAAGASYDQVTYTTHIWLITDSSGACLGTYVASASTTVVITKPSAQSQSTATASPTQLTFKGVAGGAPAQGSIEVGGTAGQAFAASTSSAWLKVSPSSGSIPASLQVTADPAGLSATTYTGSITISAPGATPPSLSVAVVFTVTAPSGPALSVTPSSLGFLLQQNGAPATQSLSIVSQTGTLAFTVTGSSEAPWLTVSPLNGTSTPSRPASVSVTADPSGLAPGSYAATVRVAAGSEQAVIPVDLTISPSGPRIALSQAGLTFQAVSGVGVVPSQSVAVSNAGSASLDYVTQVSTSSGGSWLSVSPASGTIAPGAAPSNLQVAVSPSGLAAGDYYGRITVRTPDGTTSLQTILVAFRIAPAAATLGAVVRPAALVFVAPQGGTTAAQTFTIFNISSNSTSVSLLADTSGPGSFLTPSLTSGTVTPAAPLTVFVAVSAGSFAAGIYTESLLLQFGDGQSMRVPVVLVVAPRGSSASKLKSAAGCAPTQLVPVFTALGQNFTVPAAWPSVVDLLVVDDCGDFLNTGSATVSFSNGDAPISLQPQSGGHWSGTWTGVHASASVSVTASVRSADGSVSGTATVGGALQSNPGVPIVNAGGVVSSAAFAAGQPAGPGSLVAIFGSGLSAAVDIAKTLPLPQELQTTQVVLGGRVLPIYTTSDGQLNVSVPYDVPVNTQLPLLVERGNAISVPQQVIVAAAQPAIFTVDSTGRGQGHVYAAHADGTLSLATPADPAHAGSVVVIICSGLGAVSPTIPDGASPSGRSDTVNPVTVSFGGMSVPAAAAVVLGGTSGVYQVNAVIPNGVSTGDQVPVTLTVAGQTSPPVSIGIQ